jgi:Ca2+-transporting ATPase
LNIFQGIFKNYLFLGIIFIEIVLQFVIVQFLNKFAQTVKLNAKWWGLCIAIGFVSWPVAFIFKFVPVPDKQFQPNFSCGWCGRRKTRKHRKNMEIENKLEDNDPSGSPALVPNHGENVNHADKYAPSNGEISTDEEKSRVANAV